MAKITLKDIAAEAGVSLQTVSNVVNGRSARVSATTVERVQGIIDARGYVANASARSLAAKSSRLIGLLVPSRDTDPVVLSPHHVAAFGALEKRIRDSGYHLLFRGVADTAEAERAVSTWDLDAAVLLGFVDEQVDLFRPSEGTPVLALDSYSANASTTGVRSDDRGGGRLAAAHLLGLGHRRIAFASPAFSEVGLVRQRFNGFIDAHREAGVEWDEQRLIDSDPSWEDGVAAGRRLAVSLRSGQSDVTAVFATADTLAAGLVEGLTSSGIAVPERVSVVGFDDIELAHQVSPKLTTVRQDVERKAGVAAELAIREMAGSAVPGEPVVVPVELVIRESTAPVRDA